MAISFEEARQQILSSTKRLGSERVQLLDAARRVFAEDFHSPWDLPRYDNSAMDGFAIQAVDATAQIELIVNGYISAGSDGLQPVLPGCAVKIMTGAPIPPGCEVVVPVEDTVRHNDRIRLLSSFHSRDNVRCRGEDIVAGTMALPAGTLLRPAEINLLASFGQSMVPVFRRPRVAILSTGDELIELGMPLQESCIINSNTYSIAAAVRDAGGEPILLGIARDTRESLREKLAQGLTADVLITSAGVSTGDCDLVREVLQEFAVEEKFWRIAIKPGRPTAFAVKGETMVFSLPGNPVSTLVTFEFFVRPALRKMQGMTPAIRPCTKAALAEPIRKRAERVQFERVRVCSQDGRMVAFSSGDQNTGILSTMVRANGIAVLPAERVCFDAGDEIEVLMLD